MPTCVTRWRPCSVCRRGTSSVLATWPTKSSRILKSRTEMISLKGKCAADGNYYIDTAVEYYNPDAPGEAPGQWMDTEAARALGLAGKVKKTVFLNACNGFAADGVTKLRQNAGKDNAQAFT